MTYFGHDELELWGGDHAEAPFDAAITLLDDILRSVTASFDLGPVECDPPLRRLGRPAPDTPAAEAPAAETPATEAPVAEALATETAPAEAPAVETPAAEAPAVETPAAEAPAAETPPVSPPPPEPPTPTPSTATAAPVPAPPSIPTPRAAAASASGPPAAPGAPCAAAPARRRPSRDTILVALDAGVAMELEHWANHLGVEVGDLIDEALRCHLGRLAGADGSPPAARRFSA